ncbi:MAG: sulfite exporter TauE/SafE family protein [Clostridia bacterium]
MQIAFEVLICFIAGMGAGLGTGFAGLSAAAVISPMLITFLGFDAYEAIGIALASDVLASAVSAYTYGKSKNIDIKNGIVMLISVLVFTLIGSFIASHVPNGAMGNFSKFMTLLVGLKFIFKPITKTNEIEKNADNAKKNIKSIICGALVGFICGFVGAGGGMLMLLILTSVLKYDLKTAVGTSVFIMTFTALTGAVSHFAIGGRPNLLIMILCVLFTFIWARIGARWANKADVKKLNRVTGIVLTILGIIMFIA